MYICVMYACNMYVYVYVVLPILEMQVYFSEVKYAKFEILK